MVRDHRFYTCFCPDVTLKITVLPSKSGQWCFWVNSDAITVSLQSV
uniref:Uncharacterized protein n=1 Tax=Anguilla anguilla TaxID=7936 RepID=A0A0E9WYJ2_ANGAN